MSWLKGYSFDSRFRSISCVVAGVSVPNRAGSNGARSTHCAAPSTINSAIALPVADEKSSPRPQLMHELAYLLLVVLAAALRRVLMNCVEVSVSIGE